MPAFSTRIEERGCSSSDWLLVRDGELREAATLDLLRSARHPSRNPGVNMADLRRADRGQREGGRRAGPHGRHFRLDGAGLHGARAGQRRSRCAGVIGALRDGGCAYELDNGSVIR